MTALESYGVQVTETDDCLRLSWENRDVPKDNCLFGWLVLFGLVWVPGTLHVTALLLSGEAILYYFSIWCVCWVGTLLIAWLLLGRTWSEWVELTPESVRHGFTGLLAPRLKTYPLIAGAELIVGHYDTSESKGFVTLNLLWGSPSGIKKRIMLGYWLAP